MLLLQAYLSQSHYRMMPKGESCVQCCHIQTATQISRGAYSTSLVDMASFAFARGVLIPEAFGDSQPRGPSSCQQLLCLLVRRVACQEATTSQRYIYPVGYVPTQEKRLSSSLYSNSIYAISRNTWGTFVKFIFVVYKKTIGYYTVSIFSIRCDIIALSYLGKVEIHCLID